MVKYLVDTDVLIDHFKGVPAAVELIKKIGGLSGTAISAITLAEILEGAMDFPRKMEKIKTVLDAVETVPVDKKVAEIFAAKRHELRKQRNLIDNMDLLIAATAIVHGLTLATRNKKHFSRIEGLKILSP